MVHRGLYHHGWQTHGRTRKLRRLRQPLNAARLAAIKKMGNDAAPACTITVLRDEERIAEYNQVCTYPKQTIHSTLRAVDDKTIATEISFPAPDGSAIVTHTTSHYLGACTPAQTAEAEAAAATPLPTIKPSPADCAELASSRQQAEEGLKSCESADFPADMRDRCRTQMQGALKTLAQVERSCKQ